MDSSHHALEGEDPGSFNTDPPSSGPHDETPLDAGLYDETAAMRAGPYPAGHLVHNLEHGYVILWYNCKLIDIAACVELKGQIQEVIVDAHNTKVIAFPWILIDVPVVMTSWGRMLPFENFNTTLARRFVTANHNKAPEPQAP
ncbi:MAG: DUF3105 domain-containing protein [Anaerolineales bacterium]|nr:DUF3105 domain-containing protein [Anaerolineales bacterium]